MILISFLFPTSEPLFRLNEKLLAQGRYGGSRRVRLLHRQRDGTRPVERRMRQLRHCVSVFREAVERRLRVSPAPLRLDWKRVAMVAMRVVCRIPPAPPTPPDINLNASGASARAGSVFLAAVALLLAL